MTVDPASIRARFPVVFDAVADASLQGAIDSASSQLSAGAYGALYDEARTLLAAHMAELGKPGRASGLVRGKAGQVEIDYGAHGLGQTSFGALFRELQKRVSAIRAPFVSGFVGITRGGC